MYFAGPQNHGITFNTVVMSKFLKEAEAFYLPKTPYHNWYHAVDVTHCVYRLFNICFVETYLSGTDRFALLISALAHDIGHQGMSNPFLIETSHELALRYNDKSPLENMHCATLFELLGQTNLNVFSSMTKQQIQDARNVCIEAILYTDNAHHFPMIKDVQMFYEVHSDIFDAGRNVYNDVHECPTKDVLECFRLAESRKVIIRLLLHLSDISNPLKPFKICRVWAWKVLDEFFLQGDTEKSLGMPVQALNDRAKVNRPFSQVGFIEFLVHPLVYVVVKILPPLQLNAEQMLTNLHTWQQMWRDETDPKPKPEEQRLLAERIGKLDALYSQQLGLKAEL
eukprot:gnl/TRDRNA2_/TRDRNA2_140656_c1_seq1.p1 gnl/TRDRNA2_/TRDRNA2_140656_c1~~gnl/TRDRNA2_/TRDRNA2_140656_c1_seq1.p1  ORF type:complete len:350 (-),score=76.09 gnl/TRDRNA2_/TRDRNA2_140656_c1_seq1:71-1087(-)